MKKRIYIISAIFFALTTYLPFFIKSKIVLADMRLSYLAIVIDDFGGYNRNGVNEMLSLDCNLTCAVMPALEYTSTDAEVANQNGHEVIVHMPMEAHIELPKEWYGNLYIKNNDAPKIARNKLEQALSLVPYAKGINVHIGSGVCQNKEIITELMQSLKSKDMYFCDSKTTNNSVCEDCARECMADFIARDEFLETTHNADYQYTRQTLIKSAKMALQNGYSVAIGHVGAEGGISTYQAIRDTLNDIINMGVEIVPLSKIVSVKYGRSR